MKNKNELHNSMKVFISGASGLVGSNCLQYFQSQQVSVVGSHLSYPTTDTVFFDTLSPEHSENFDLVQYNPDVIIHCGALTHVDYCETNEAESYTKTVQSTINLCKIAQTCNAKLVFISTDYVFDGKAGPYTETAVPNPLNIYGRHKWEAEQYIQKHHNNHLIIRVTNVYGKEARNKNFVARILEQIKAGQDIQLKLPHDQYASPTNAWDIARALFLLCKENKTGIYHIGSTDYMNRVSLALRVLKYFPAAKFNLASISTLQLQQAALRPLKGGFIAERFNQEFPDFLMGTLDDYLNSL